MHAKGLLWHAGRRYGRCCMYGPNYVKLSRVFAVQLFSMFIGHYAALPPFRSDPHWPHSHAITATIRLALTHALQHPLLATQTSTVATTTCLDYLHSHIRTMRPSTASPIYLYAYSQRILGVAPSALALRQDTATHTARDSNLDSGNHDMSRRSALAYLNDAAFHGLTDISLAYFQRILGVAPSILALAETRQHTLLATQTSTVVTTTCLDYLHSHT
jgi:hypothetical protein